MTTPATMTPAAMTRAKATRAAPTRWLAAPEMERVKVRTKKAPQYLALNADHQDNKPNPHQKMH